MEQIIAELKKIPPITRFVCVSTAGTTISVMMQLLDPKLIVYFHPWVWGKFQLWRVPSSFFLASTNINFVFEMAMLYRNLNQIETGYFLNKSADLAWQMLFIAGSIIVATRPVGSVIFLHPLLASLTYVSSALAPPGAQTSLMGLVTLPVAYFPYVMVVLDFLMVGPGRAAEAVAGLVVGHMWWWGVWGGSLGSQGVLAQYGQAPQWLRNLFGEGRRPRPPAAPRGNATGGAAAGLRAAGIEVVPPRRAANAEAEGHQWGVGNRLGS
ncbi:hypothetical protein EST38_g9016 [Candolleomyces aberdarensis]|uniref:Derlin n=1 Tax=Candolleomyces aberdarensis TaxID=2316362 RepID=A0A4V1Q2Z7_9AGAR|nr:hypothetical protein EST38_g9016 [Candolleomyces aberdarensis]